MNEFQKLAFRPMLAIVCADGDKKDAEIMRTLVEASDGNHNMQASYFPPAADQMKFFQIYSAQTGNRYGFIEATSEGEAIDKWAQSKGHINRARMWESCPGWAYISAYELTDSQVVELGRRQAAQSMRNADAYESANDFGG